MGLSEEQVEEFKKNVLAEYHWIGWNFQMRSQNSYRTLASDDRSYITGIELFVDGIAQI